MDRERLIAWNLELQSAHHALEAALNQARTSITTGQVSNPLARNLTLHCRGFCHALDDHHHSEDAALFPELLTASPELNDAIAALMQDHRTLAGLLKVFAESLANFGAPNDTERDHLDAQLDHIEKVMKNHFSDEEHHLHTALRTFSAHPSEKKRLLGSAPQQ